MHEVVTPARPAEKTTAITNVRLVDGYGRAPVETATVLIRGAKILKADSVRSDAIPEDAERVDGSGMTVLPGLLDSHFHSRNDPQRLIDFELNHGITAFRDPGHPWKYYADVMVSDLTLPRVFLNGGHLDGDPPIWPDQAVVVLDAKAARRAVHAHVDRGASAIKIYFRLPLEFYEPVCEAAAERGVPVTAHLELVDADDAIRAGVRGIEHVSSFGTALAEPEDAKAFKEAVAADPNTRKVLRHKLWATLDLDNNPRVKPLIDLIVANDVFVSPTLAIYEKRAGEKGASEEDERGFANMLRFIGLCHEAGARIVVGSHTSAPYAERGMAYQREMELLIKAGLSPMEVIEAGTLQNAKFFGAHDRLGGIRAGNLADLVLVEGKPDVDIAAMKRVQRVMLNGSWVEME
ncbi:MAG: amidohydrolase family protein [Planctomycetota bacterium]